MLKKICNFKKRSRPVIGITAANKKIVPGAWATYLLLKMAGAKCIILKPQKQSSSVQINGLVISGGSDLDPWHYKEEITKSDYRYDRERDYFEISLIKRCIEKNIPALGICRGSQLINVALGGNLHHDIRELRQKKHPFSVFFCNAVTLKKGSILRAILSRKKTRINSLHYQACNRLGEGLIACARDSDNIIQAIEHAQQWLVGVQWHPEYLGYSKAQRKIFSALKMASDKVPAVTINLEVDDEYRHRRAELSL